MVGALNGIAVATKKDFWHVGMPVEPKQVFFWMDRHCAENPLDILMTGIFSLVSERLGEDWNAP